MRRARALFIAWMGIALVLVTALAFWDEQRESAAALADFAEMQTTTARALAAGIAPRLAAATSDADIARIEEGAAAIEQTRAVLVLFRRREGDDLVTTGGPRVDAPAIAEAFARGEASVRLSRAESAALGLPARTAMVGLAPLARGARGPTGVAVVATAERERDREIRAAARLVLGVVVACALVFAFGGAALARERKELAIAGALAIAERDERLERAAKLAALGALATGIAHEVSTPLGVIVGRAEQLAAKVEGDERGSRAARTILEQAERISAIVRGILALVRGDDVAFAPVKASELARTAADLVEHRFARAGVSLAQVDHSEGARIACEERLFAQVLVNLLLNACDACARGGHVSLEVARADDKVEFLVVDDGAGIPPEVAARVTEPFVSTKGVAGSGMGLAIAGEIVKHHRGALALTSSEGTRARVTVPIARDGG